MRLCSAQGSPSWRAEMSFRHDEDRPSVRALDLLAGRVLMVAGVHGGCAPLVPKYVST